MTKKNNKSQQESVETKQKVAPIENTTTTTTNTTPSSPETHDHTNNIERKTDFDDLYTTLHLSKSQVLVLPPNVSLKLTPAEKKKDSIQTTDDIIDELYHSAPIETVREWSIWAFNNILAFCLAIVNFLYIHIYKPIIIPAWDTVYRKLELDKNQSFAKIIDFKNSLQTNVPYVLAQVTFILSWVFYAHIYAIALALNIINTVVHFFTHNTIWLQIQNFFFPTVSTVDGQPQQSLIQKTTEKVVAYIPSQEFVYDKIDAIEQKLPPKVTEVLTNVAHRAPINPISYLPSRAVHQE